MKKLLFILCFFISIVNAAHIHWLGNYDKALEKSLKEQKPIMVLLVKKSSPKCNDIIKKYFMETKYIELLNQKFVSVIVTYEGKVSYPIEMFYSTIFPTLFFVNSQTELFLFKPLYGDMINENSIKNSLYE